jgi:hypothetical protein
MNPYWLLVIPAVLALWWMEWGKVKCKGVRIPIEYTSIGRVDGITHDKLFCVCHGTGRVRRGWISGLFKRS